MALVTLIIAAVFVVSLPAAQAAGVRVGRNIDIRGETGADRQVLETSIAVDPVNPDIIVAGAGDLTLKEGPPWEGYYRSTDGGAKWSSRLIPGFPGDTSSEGQASPLKQFDGCIDPSLAFDRLGNLYYTGSCGKVTSTGAPQFGTLGVFVAKFANDGVDYVGAVVVDHGHLNPDFPKIAVDTTGGANDGNVYLDYGRDSNGQTLFTRSTDGGLSFSNPFQLPGAGISWDVAVDSGGNVYAATSHCTGGGGDLHACLQPSPGPADILVAKSTDAGLSFSHPSVAASITAMPFSFPGNNLGLATPGVTIAADAQGVYLVTADYSQGNANVLFTRSTDGGVTWTSPIRVNDVTLGQHFYPAIAASGGVISVAWYDSRLGQLSNGTITGLDVFYAESKDGGASFSANVRVTDVSFDPNLVFFPLFVPLCQCAFFGDYIDIAASPDAVHPIWTDNRNACDTLDSTFGCVDQDAFTAMIRP